MYEANYGHGEWVGRAECLPLRNFFASLEREGGVDFKRGDGKNNLSEGELSYWLTERFSACFALHVGEFPQLEPELLPLAQD